MMLIMMLINVSCEKLGKGDEKAGRAVYVGIEEKAMDYGKIKKFMKSTKLQPQIAVFDYTFEQVFDGEYFLPIVLKGTVPLVTWQPWLRFENELVEFDSILAGEWDDYIALWAKKIKAFQYPVLISFAPDSNNKKHVWYVEGIAAIQKYERAYRYIDQVFKKIGANNAIWVWQFVEDSALEGINSDDFCDLIGVRYLDINQKNMNRVKKLLNKLRDGSEKKAKGWLLFLPIGLTEKEVLHEKVALKYLIEEEEDIKGIIYYQKDGWIEKLSKGQKRGLKKALKDKVFRADVEKINKISK
jgi:hypothetical protein